MRVVIMGCGRVGLQLSIELAEDGGVDPGSVGLHTDLADMLLWLGRPDAALAQVDWAGLYTWSRVSS